MTQGGAPLARPSWRLMRPDDLPAVIALSGVVHPTFFEAPAMFLDRIALYPEGALVAEEAGGQAGLAAYALAYPVPLRDPPPLDTVLGRIPDESDALYLHDVAVAPAWRGRGLASPAIRRLLDLAEARFAVATLVSVYGTSPFWERFGFRSRPDVLAAGKLASYGDEAVFMMRPSAARDRPDAGG